MPTDSKGIILQPAKPIINLTDVQTKPLVLPDNLNPQSNNFNKSTLPKIGLINFGQIESNNTTNDLGMQTINPLDTSDYHCFWGTLIYNSNTVTGVEALQQVQPNYILNTETLYAPTLMGPTNCPLEAVSCYYGGKVYVQVWDHNLDNVPVTKWIYQAQVDTAFQNKYVRYLSNIPQGYQVEILHYNGVWYCMLYNWVGNYWETIATDSTSLPVAHGWDMWETHFTEPYPTSQPVIESQGLMELDTTDNNWHLVDTSRGFVDTSPPPDVFPFSGYSWSWVAMYHDWKVWK